MRATIPDIDARREELIGWRRDLHAHPELAFEERRTSDFVAAELRRIGLDVHVGLGRTGVVASLTAGPGPAIALRADMDALPLQERNVFAHRSRFDGRMHACGHDGHTVMLLAAARHLAEHHDFDGTVRFVFQPAEEGAGGAKAMIEEGLFERFPVDRVFGMHNWPGLPEGSFAMRPGPIMASMDAFDATITGRGGHGALPHHGVDPVHAFAQTVVALQSIVSRGVDPLRSAVVSVTKVHGGDAHNVIPESISFGGALRALDPGVRRDIRARLEGLVQGIAGSLGARGEVEFGVQFPPVVNDPDATRLAAAAAAEVVGDDAVTLNAEPVLGSEDFSLMLERRPGCYVFIGNGDGEGSCMIHNPQYDFNDEVLTIGAAYWVRLAEAALGR
ncbi:MAG: amidohydrolase [Gammaproteobacteria bacterium]|nr:amidohydrolase [Gammaproteobacteria bacterium]